MNAFSRIAALAALGLLVMISTACTITPSTTRVVAGGPQVVYVDSPPPRVYHSGTWLYYRTDGYYYQRGPTWYRASHVPSHVVHYHSSSRPVHVTSSRPVHVQSSRPVHVQSGRPVHVSSRPAVRTSRPAVRTSRPATHVQRTTSNRRTYIRR